ncbi:MAG: ribose 5-phosphate isomerase B [Bacilli bacterium]
MRIAIGSDHGGFELKTLIKEFLIDEGYEVFDFGCKTKDSVDYPNYGFAVGEAVASKEYDRGIVICGSGIGISIAANKVKGIRCALVNDVYVAKMTRMHNDSNVLAMGGRIIGAGLAKEIVKVWITTDYDGGRHDKRLEIINDYEKKGDK